jgi:hypothetical protein
MTSCVFSFLSLEAAINRVYYDIFIRTEPARISINSGIPIELIEFIRSAWHKVSIREKYLILPSLITDSPLCRDKSPFDINKQPFNLFVEFVSFRNKLVHPKMIELTYDIEISAAEENSYGGKVIGGLDAMKNPVNTFPLTKFSTTFFALSINDAEKAFEIAYRMLQSLYNKTSSVRPFITLQNDEGILQIKALTEILDIIQLRFGPIETENVQNK